MVREVGLILSNVPVKHHRAIGWYFLAVAANSVGNGDQDEAKRLFELVVDEAPDSYKAKAILSLGALAVHRNDFDSASHCFQETIKAEKIGMASLQAIRGVSLLKSIEGFHKSAITDLEGILPIVRYAPLKVRLDCLNSYAVELSEVGRLQEAENVSALVITSPLARYYPEWQETLSDVRSKRKRRFVVTISRPRIEQEDEADSEAKSEAESEGQENALQTARIQTVIDFMNINLHRKIPLTELAEVASVSQSHLSRLFNLHTGLSPGDYLIKLRMEKARHLLVTSFLSIKQVMATLGYDPSSRANFVDQFKRYFVHAPSEYRKRFFTRSIEQNRKIV